MADSKPEQALDILQQTINDILIQTGKALKAAQSQGPRNVEQVHAKSVLTRDLEKLRAAKASSMSPVAIKNETPKPVFQSPVPIPTIPKAAKAPTPKMQQKQIQQQQQQMRNAAAQNMAASRPVAPIPDMGIDIPAPSPAQSVTSPVVIKKEAKASSATPKTKASTLANGGKGEAKRSPAIKSSTPIPIPVIPTAQTQAPSSVQTPVPVPPVPAAAMTPAPPAPTAPPAPMSVMDTSQFGLPPSMAGGTNFTDMEFTVAQGSDPANHTPGHSMSLDMGGNIDTIDLDSFFDAPHAGSLEPQEPASPLNHDDIYDLGSATTESMDLDFALGQGGGSTSYIDDLFFGSGDGSMGDLADFN
ncbi:unnamed protein product [Parascedosporium putredinis]|uniref:Uncharacterized protein n=1 Tax=Parascedosporium putredinis TaxID=1442378 RepID=A0A9P1GXJ0_9PEZI|nr:unnamed protein product [Parascedosporium putredinis]CAI7989280.1 unnamed protein product [Parascedosporium putredinis]